MRSSVLLVFLITIGAAILVPCLSSDVGLSIDLPGPNRTTIKKDLVQFIQESQETILAQKSVHTTSLIRPKAVMVLGLTGTGKSTLVNYLNGVSLLSRKFKDKLVIEAAENETLPGGFSIGHSIKSETLFPAVYSPPGRDFSYVDNPGFKDTRGLETDIANGYFREMVTRGVTHLKFVLLITHPDLKLRGQQFRESMNAFAEFLGAFDEADEARLQKLASAIGIVVTRVENDGDSDAEMKEILRERLVEIIDEERQVKRISRSQESVFRRVVGEVESNIEIFSSPVTPGRVGAEQSAAISTFIADKLEYLPKNEAIIRVRVDQSSIPKLLTYIRLKYGDLELAVDSFIDQYTSKVFSNELSKARRVEDLGSIEQQMNKVVEIGAQVNDLAALVGEFRQDLIDRSQLGRLHNRLDVVDFFVKLLPHENQLLFKTKRSWLSLSSSERVGLLKAELAKLSRQFPALYESQTGVFVYKGFFVKLSAVADALKQAAGVRNLSSVRVFASHSIQVDANFSVPGERFASHSPDLCLVSPVVVFVESVTVDLSSKHSPGHPDGEERAPSGLTFGARGSDGKPGLRGFNGGDLLVIANTTEGVNSFTFVSNGGQGGPGQLGGNGADGETGQDASYESVEEKRENFIQESGIRYDKDGTKERWVEFYGVNGQKGGRGGDAGLGACGGSGGISGAGLIVHLNSSSSGVRFIRLGSNGDGRVPGPSGKDGTPGSPGMGGLSGRKAVRGKHFDNKWICHDSCCLGGHFWKNHQMEADDGRRAESGQRLADLTSCSGRNETRERLLGLVDEQSWPHFVNQRLKSEYSEAVSEMLSNLRVSNNYDFFKILSEYLLNANNF